MSKRIFNDGWWFTFFAIAYLLVDYLLVVTVSPALRQRGIGVPGASYDWTGKLLSLGLATVLVLVWPWLRDHIGLRLRQASGSLGLSLVGFGTCVAMGVYAGLLKKPVAFDAETFLFQSTMPSLAEEVAIRGIALALLERAFRQDPMSCRLRFGAAAIILTLLFGLAHAMTVHESGIGFRLYPFLNASMFAAIVTVVRIRSGSLLWPILCHTALNLTIQVVAWIR